MKLAKGILGFLWKIYFLIIVLLTIIILYPLFFVLLQNEKYFQSGFKLIRWQAKVILFFAGIRKEVIGNIPNDTTTNYIICPNHSSYLDILLLYASFPNYFIFLGKKELGNVPLFNIYFKKMNILVDRKNPKSAHQSIAKACEVMEKGSNLVIFPEGTIPKSVPQLKPFKNGAFRVALQLKMSIIPVTFKDNYRLLEDSWSLTASSRPGLSRVYIHEPIEVSKTDEWDLLTLREETKKRIASKLDE
ncbi:MAG: lysophospholipid acyltransferase family protein [Vicingaceae bacterium]